MVSNFIQQDCGVMFQHLVELCLALLNYVRKFDRQAELYKTVWKLRLALLNCLECLAYNYVGEFRDL